LIFLGKPRVLRGYADRLRENEMHQAIHWKWKSIAISTSACALLLIELPTWNLNFSPTKVFAVNKQMQETGINLSATDLKRPHILSVSTSQSVTQITGDIKLNGKPIKKLSRNSTRIDLAPSLKIGKNIVAVSGRYSPASTSINVEFTGPNNHISQQMGGNGTINQVLVIKVQ
jgi:hypothetical protein